jgi:hypothetical protein
MTPMPTRRIVSARLSSRIVEYLNRSGHKRSQIAKLLGVSEAFVDLVKRREFSLTVDHVVRLTGRLAMPLGEFLVAVAESRDGQRKGKRHDSFVRIMRLADRADQATVRAISKPRRKAS